MALDPVAAFMLGIIVGQWLGILLILKVVKAALNRPSGVAVESPNLSQQAGPIARLFGLELLGTTKPRVNVAKSIPPLARKSQSKQENDVVRWLLGGPGLGDNHIELQKSPPAADCIYLHFDYTFGPIRPGRIP
jgi:hypothetical protein